MQQDRELETREKITEVFNALYPNVLGNPYIPHWPTPPQAKMLGLHLHSTLADGQVFEALYGGAAGGGKTDLLLMAAAQYAWKNPEYSGICLRRTYTELALPGAIMDRARHWWPKHLAHWDGSQKIFTFHNGARIKMGYHRHPSHNALYQGSNYQFAGWDEVTHWPDDSAYRYISLSRLRRPAGSDIPLRAIAASNPGSAGHVWVKNRFVGGIDINTGKEVIPQHPFVPAKIEDNPHIDQNAYVQSLMRLHPTLRKQLLAGDWSAREPGDYFRSEWFGPLLDYDQDELPQGGYIGVRWWDLAASTKADAARTAGVLMVRLRSGVRAVVHAVAFRETPGSRDAKIIKQAHLDGRHITVGLEIEGGSGGPAQFDALAKRLRAEGFRVTGARPRVIHRSDAEERLVVRQPGGETGKMGRADPVASCLERGFQRRGEADDTGQPWWGVDIGLPFDRQRDGLRLYIGRWTQAYLDEIECFPDAARMDLVDATSGAWAYLEAHPFGQRAGELVTRAVTSADDDDGDEKGKDRGGRWRP